MLSSVIAIVRLRGCGRRGDQLHEHLGVEKVDAVIAPEMLALVVPVVGVGLRIAFLGVDDERPLPLGELAVGHDVDALVTDEPDAGLLVLAGREAVVRVAEAAVQESVDAPRIITARTTETVNVNITASVTLPTRRAGSAGAPAASPRSPRR
jgi:hypothetical protein